MGDVEIIKPHMLCKVCGVQKIARLEIIMCKECATAYDKGFSYHPKKEYMKEDG